ncbi:MAG: class II glutamine amidotransferase, partial [Defluviitaleaceae bacterium]|nr:class II glutamine amidotransferase [Defluviitaleaceae bacterium]
MLTEIRGATEECGVFGIWGAEDSAALTYYGLHSLQHRGQHGAGIVVKNGTELTRQRGMGLVSEVFTREVLENMKGDAAIGHVRNVIAGQNRVSDTQPFLFQFENSSLALCHNGNIVNNHSLRRELEAAGSIFSSRSDSEVLAHLIKRQHKDTFVDNVKAALSRLKGAFAYLILTPTEMIAALDP